MSDFQTAYDFNQANEDRMQLHAIVPDSPPGAFAISGVNSAAWPADFKRIANIPQAQRGPAIEAFYRANFWNQWFAQLASNDVAERVFDCAVNSGMGTAVRALQRAILSRWAGSGTQPLMEDGLWGPQTVAFANACNPLTLVPAFRLAHMDWLKEHCADNPALPELIARAQE